MDIYLLQLLGNWFSVFCVTLTSFFGINSYKEDSSDIDNLTYTKNATVLNQVINYQTEYVYNNQKPLDSAPTILQEGQYGFIYQYDNGETKVMKNATNQIIELGTGRAVNYTARITTYTPYCKGCSKYGNVACKANGKKFSLITNGQYYVDNDFGKVRIVAAALTAFPCGTIMTIDTGKYPQFTAIVLDTGGSMRKAYREGYVWLDLAYSAPNKEEAKLMNTKNAKIQVLRWGW